MIDTKNTKARLLSLAFKGALIDYPIKNCFNEALEKAHKAQKKYIPVTEEECLIDAPAYWNWSRLGYLTRNHGQTTPDFDFCYIDVGTLDNVNHRLSENENLVEAKDAPSRARKKVMMGDVLYSTVRPYLHNICIVDKEFSRTPIASTAFCVMEANQAVLDNKFLFYWLLTTEFDKYSNGDPSKGALYPAIGEKDLLQGTIPIPPLGEQKQIVAKIDSAFSVLDIIDILQKQYADNMTILKSKLLNAAIQGKLTMQLPEDGSAEDLLLQMKEKKPPVAKGKNGKHLQSIKVEEVPFDIPENWAWCRLADIASTNIGLTYHPEDVVDDGTIVLRSSNIIDSKIDYTDLVKVSCPIRDNQYVNKNDIVICARNGSKALVGKCAIFEGNAQKVSFGAFMAILRTPFYKYVFYYLLTNAFRRYFHSDDSKQINQVTQTILKEALVPLPPLAEQIRITEKLDAVMKLLDSQH